MGEALAVPAVAALACGAARGDCTFRSAGSAGPYGFVPWACAGLVTHAGPAAFPALSLLRTASDQFEVFPSPAGHHSAPEPAAEHRKGPA